MNQRTRTRTRTIHTAVEIAIAVVIAIAITIVTGCGGNTPPAAPAAVNATSTLLPLPGITLPASGFLSPAMIGQVWEFKNGFGDVCEIHVEAPEAMTRTEADGTVTEITWTDPDRLVAGRGGVNIVLHYTKGVSRCYWLLGVEGAELWFVLHQREDQSWRSIASVILLPKGCPWCGKDGAPSTARTLITYDIEDNQPGMPVAYQIGPPTMRGGDAAITLETRASGIGSAELTFNNLIPAMAIAGPADGEYFATSFRVGWVRAMDFSVITDTEELNACTRGADKDGNSPGCLLANISDQYEGACGHERWIWALGLGFLRVESPNDGGQVKNDPRCATSGDQPGFDAKDPRLTIVRRGI